MVNFKQAVKLQAAGFPVENGFQEKELMEFLKRNTPSFSIVPSGSGWMLFSRLFLIVHPDLTEALVQACVAVLQRGPELLQHRPEAIRSLMKQAFFN